MSEIIRGDRVTGLAAVYLTGPRFGVSIRDERLLGDGDWIDDDAPRRYANDLKNYRGWTAPSALHCGKCWTLMHGVPRDIIETNICTGCKEPLYSATEVFFDSVGFEIYRDRCNRYMGIATYHFRAQIDGGLEHLKKDGRVTAGYHKDHIFSVRDGFEQRIPERVIACPLNISVIEQGENLSKGRSSHISLSELMARCAVFESAHPKWLEKITASDKRQFTFVYTERDS